LEDLRQAVDGENVSTLRFIISMMPSEWAAMLQRAQLHLPHQNYEVRPARYCYPSQRAISARSIDRLPRHTTHFEPSFPEFSGIL